MNYQDWEHIYFASFNQLSQTIDAEVLENRHSVDFFIGNTNFRNIHLANFFINYTEYDLLQDTRSYCDLDLDAVQMCFSLEGGTDLFTIFNAQMISQKGGQHTLLYAGQHKGYYDLLGKSHKAFYINLKPSFFLETLYKLAQKVGTNEFTLKQECKALFGISVLQYWKRLRLWSEKELFCEQGLSVQETSHSI